MPSDRKDWSELKSETELLLKNNAELALSKAKYAGIIAESLGDHELICKSEILISDIFLKLGQIDSTIHHLHRARATNNFLHDEPSFEITNKLGNAFNVLPNLDSAKHYYMLSRQLALANSDSLQSAIAQNNMGLVYLNTGELNLAVESFLASSRYFEKINDMENLADSYINLGMANQKAANFQQSLLYFNKAVTSYEQSGDQAKLLKAYGNIAISNNRIGNYDTAIYYFDQAAALATQRNMKSDLTQIAYNQGNTYMMMGDTAAAMRAFNKSMAMAKEIDHPMGIFYNNYKLSLLDLEAKQWGKVTKRLEEMQQFIDASGMKSLQAILLEVYYQLDEKRGDFAKALDYYKKYKIFNDSLRELARKEEIEKIQMNYEMEKKDLENRRLRDTNLIQKKTIQTQRLIGASIVITLLLFVVIIFLILSSKRKLSAAYQKLSELNHEISKQKKALETSNETKDKMFSVIAHDLRSPFNSLLGFLDILLNDFQGFDDEEKLEILAAMQGQGQATFELIENLLEWSMSQRGLLESQPRQMDLHQLVVGQLASLASRAESKNITIDLKLKPGSLACIDEKMMQTIVRNLTNNAIKFTPRGGRITIDGFENDSHFLLSIADTGIGMSKEIADRLFSDHFPESRNGTDSEKGTGLGLMIVKEFLMKMNASIQVKSEPGKGSEFSITLPVDKNVAAK